MKNLNVLALAGLMLGSVFVSCQKDYYLEDLKAAEAEIAQLKKDKSQLTNDINALMSEVSGLTSQNQSLNAQIQSLQSELNDVNNALQNSEIDLDNANAIIEDLRVEIAALEIKLAEEEGTVESLKNALDNLNALLAATNGENVRLNELISELKDDIAVLEGFKNAVYQSYKVKVEYDDETINELYGDSDFVNSSHFYDFTNDINHPKQVYGTYFRTVSQNSNEGKEYHTWADYDAHASYDSIVTRVIAHNDYEVVLYRHIDKMQINNEVYEDFNRIYTYRLRVSDYNQANSHYNNLMTADEIQDDLRTIGVGLYSDDIYSTLDFNDINDYVRVFKLDAKRHGINKDYITDKTSHLVVKDLGSENDNVCAWASTVCDQTHIWTEFNKDCWGIFPDDPFNPHRLEVMYHELGHSIMSYPHPLTDDSRGWPYNVGAGHNGVEDIMGYSGIQYESDGDTFTRHGHEYVDVSWDTAVDRFFAGTDHTVYNCGSGKGNIIVVNEGGNPDFD